MKKQAYKEMVQYERVYLSEFKIKMNIRSFQGRIWYWMTYIDHPKAVQIMEQHNRSFGREFWGCSETSEEVVTSSTGYIDLEIPKIIGCFYPWIEGDKGFSINQLGVKIITPDKEYIYDFDDEVPVRGDFVIAKTGQKLFFIKDGGKNTIKIHASKAKNRFYEDDIIEKELREQGCKHVSINGRYILTIK